MNNANQSISVKTWSEILGSGCDQMIYLKISTTGRIVDSSPSVAKLLGYSPQTLMTMGYYELFTAGDQLSQLPRAHAVLASSQGEYRARCLWLNSEGASVEMELLYKRVSPAQLSTEMPELNSELAVIGLVSVLAKDRPGLIDLPSAFSQETLYKTIKALSHQLRSPLTVMSLSINLLKEHFAHMNEQERREEISQVEVSLGACERILERAVEEAKKTISGHLPLVDKQGEVEKILP